MCGFCQGVLDGVETVGLARVLGAGADLPLGATLVGGLSHTLWGGFFSD